MSKRKNQRKFYQNKAQVLLVAIFVMVAAGAVIYVLSEPILVQTISLRKTINSFQAISNAESGLEIELLNQYTYTGSSSLDILASPTYWHQPMPSRSNISSGWCSGDANPEIYHRYSTGCFIAPSGFTTSTFGYFNIDVSTSTSQSGVALIIDSIGYGGAGLSQRSLIFETSI